MKTVSQIKEQRILARAARSCGGFTYTGHAAGIPVPGTAWPCANCDDDGASGVALGTFEGLTRTKTGAVE